MNNHYHLIIETPDGNLSRGMRQLNGVYTQAFNRRYRRVGHIFQGRYKAIIIDKESYLLEVSRYVVLNPVRAKAVARPEQWKWSSYRGTAGLEKAHPCLTPDWTLAQFGSKKKEAEREYRKFIGSGIGKSGPLAEVRGQSILGEEDFVEKLLPYVRSSKEVREIPRHQRYVGRPALQMIFGREGAGGRQERDQEIVRACVQYGYGQKEIADFLGLHYSTVSKIINKLEEYSSSKT
jgi:hypothetical protein